MIEQKLALLQAKIDADGSLGEKLFSMETPEEVQSLLKGQGMDFTLDEIAVLREAIVMAEEKGENGELSNEILDDVAGGTGRISISGGTILASPIPGIRPVGPRW